MRDSQWYLSFSTECQMVSNWYMKILNRFSSNGEHIAYKRKPKAIYLLSYIYNTGSTWYKRHQMICVWYHSIPYGSSWCNKISFNNFKDTKAYYMLYIWHKKIPYCTCLIQIPCVIYPIQEKYRMMVSVTPYGIYISVQENTT